MKQRKVFLVQGHFDSWEPRNMKKSHHPMNCIKGLLGRDAEWWVSLYRNRDNKGWAERMALLGFYLE